MRLLLSFIVLALLVVTCAVVFYKYKTQILIIFGITNPVPAQKVEEGDGTPSLTAESATGSNTPGPAGITLGRGSTASLTANSLSRQGSFPASERGGAAPMIVVENNDASRGQSLPYDTIAEACGNWAESRRIGAGGAATVYRAELARYGPVAVKRFHPDRQGSSREWTRELETLSQCRHPNILEILGHADEGPENLIVMPLMEGGTLGEAIPHMWWASRSTALGHVVRAVAFLHGKKVVHRDIKSSNILLDNSRRNARLADFGLAKDQVNRLAGKTSHGTTGIVVGSPGYMAPELMMRPANEKTDSFALGVVFLEILTALPAWETTEGGVLTDRAVEDGLFVESLVDRSAQWPDTEVSTVSGQAVVLTLFDPNSRKTACAVERDPAYIAHLERAGSALRTQG